MYQYAGIQIIGTQRSGSNLLRVILDQSDKIASPHPPHILTTFMPLLPLYGTLNSDSYKILIDDVVDYVEANPVPWEGIKLDKTRLFNCSRQYTLPELTRCIYEEAAGSKNSRYWCCKSMANVHFADELEKAGLNLKYVYLYRDGRDVAASFKKAVVGEKHTYFLAKQWRHDQEACLRLEAKMDPSRFYKLSYETLISNPVSTVKSLCAFLDIPYTEAMLSFYESRTSRLTAEAGDMWRNLKKPIMHHNTGKYQQEFQEKDLEIFEAVAGEVLLKLGYSLHSNAHQHNDTTNSMELLSSENISLYKDLNAALKKETLQKAKPSDLENRRAQEKIIADIKSRALVFQ